jgi:cytochrome c553
MAMAACLALPISAMAAPPTTGDIDTGQQIYMSGLGKQVPACQKCHGADGLGSDDIGTPRLASQVYTYLYKQMTDFASGKRTDTIMHKMNAIAKAMSDQQRMDVSAYLHELKWPYTGSDLQRLHKEKNIIGDASRGATIVNYGIPSEGVAACQSCHGYRGHSAGMLFPVLSGQNYIYLEHELASFRSAARGQPNGRTNDYMGLMRAVAGKLTNRDIEDVSAYLTAVKPPPPPDNPMDPRNS